MTEKAVCYYEAHIEFPRNSDYATFRLTLYPQDRFANNSRIEIIWHSERHKRPLDWYGMQVEVTARHLEDLTIATKWAKRALKTDAAPYAPISPRQMLEKLARSRTFVESLYDPRLHQHVPLEDVPDPSLARFMDSFEEWNPGSQNITVDCLALDAEAAKPLLCAEFAKLSRYEDLQRFIDAGMPVRVDSWHNTHEVPIDPTPALTRLGAYE
jgi:hypothetical protein